jgi:hypothetical protein
MKKIFVLSLLLTNIFVVSAVDMVPPMMKLNASSPLNITSNITILLLANFSDAENGFIGNVTLNELSDGSAVKNITFGSSKDRIVYLNISKYSAVINANMKVSGGMENVINPVLDWPVGASDFAITPERCRTVSPPVSFDSVEIVARVKLRDNPGGTLGDGPSGLIARLRFADDGKIIEGKHCEIEDLSHSWGWHGCIVTYSGVHRINETIYACVASNDSNWGAYSVYYSVCAKRVNNESGQLFFPKDRRGSVAGVRYCIAPVFSASFDSFPVNTSVDITNNGIKEWKHEGVLNTTEMITDFSNEISQYLSTCSANDLGYCSVPLVFHSDLGGIVQISDINITYLSNQSCEFCMASDGICDTEWTISNVTTNLSDDYKSGVCSYSWNTSNYNDGIYNISFRIKDTAYNIRTSSKKIILDRTGPTFYQCYPRDNGGVNVHSDLSNITNTSFELILWYGVRDISLITNCSLIFNNKINKTDSSMQPWGNLFHFRLNISTIIEASRYINWSVICTDIFGNKGVSKIRRFNIILVGNFSGETTDFTKVNMSHIDNLTLEEVNSGKIKFSETVNLAGVSNINDYVKVSHNKIEINSSALPALNKSAILYLYNITFNNPRPLKDGVPCPSPICKEISYANNTYVFNVTHWSIYSSEETPTTSDDGNENGGGSGGGGGGGAFYVCNKEWNCTGWSLCENGWRTRKCFFVKVPQHTSIKACPSENERPIMSKKCEIVKKIEKINETKEIKEEKNKTKEVNETSSVTGMFVKEVEGKPNKLMGVLSLIILVALAVLLYYLFWHKK